MDNDDLIDDIARETVRAWPDLALGTRTAVPKAWGALVAQGVIALRDRLGRPPSDAERRAAAAETLVEDGFQVMVYCSDDPLMAKRLEDVGAVAIMPLAAPIGSGLGVQNPTNLRIMREQLPDATIIVDAGVGTASDATIAMELGADAVLMNTAIAEAEDSAGMATAMKLAIQAGRLAYRSGRMNKRLYASASSPLSGVIR